MIRTLRFRIKDKHRAWLNAQAREVNCVWNYANELSQKVLRREGRFIGHFELQKYTDGASKECGLHSHTIQAIGKEYVTRRVQFKRSRLAWRKSGGARRSLGWVPFKSSSVKCRAGQVFFNGQLLSLWDSYGLSHYALRSGCFSEDSRGRWYLNVQVEVPELCGPRLPAARGAVGIDLGLQDFATLSDGRKLEAARFYRDLEPALAVAQRANKKARTRALHAKIANRRKDALHKFSTVLAREYGALFIGNVNASGLAKTGMAKSVLDAGWSTFRTMLQYKCDSAGAWFEQVNEAYSTQTCSCCASRTGPKGVAGLGIRTWCCSVCGSEHDRDVNAAQNILLAEIWSRASGPTVLQDGPPDISFAAGRGRLAEGILVL